MAEKRSRSVGHLLSDTQTRVTNDLIETKQSFSTGNVNTGREPNFNFSILYGRLPKIVLKISLLLRIQANCRQEVHSYIIKDELYSKLANFCQINNVETIVETIAANSFGKLLSSCFPLLSIEKKLINGNRMYPSQNNFVRIQTFPFKFMAHSRVLSLNIVLEAFDVTKIISPPIFVKRKSVHYPASEPKQTSSTKKSCFKKTYHFCINN